MVYGLYINAAGKIYASLNVNVGGTVVYFISTLDPTTNSIYN